MSRDLVEQPHGIRWNRTGRRSRLSGVDPNRRGALRRSGLAALVAAPLLVACTSSSDEQAPSAPTGLFSLVGHASCDDLLDYFTEHALEEVTAWGLGPAWYGGVVPLSGGADEQWALADGSLDAAGSVDERTSATNNQVEGVDEADVVKTDGELVVAVSAGAVRVVDAASAELLATVDLDGATPGELLLDGSTLLVLGSDPPAYPQPDLVPADRAARTVLTQVDLTDPAAPEVVQSTRVEGEYRSARLVDGVVRLVVVSEPTGLDWVQPEDGSLDAETEALAANRALVEGSTVDDWLPHLSVDDGAAVPLHDCGDVGVPTEFSGFSTVSVVTLDVDGGTVPTSSAGVVGDGRTVYSSADRVVVATGPWDAWVLGDRVDGEVSETTSDLHSFDVSAPSATTYVGSGRVEGRVLNQFAIDEADGVVRVATTRDDAAGGASSSSLVVLEEVAGEGLVETGRVDGLGVGEEIRSVRYLSPDLAAVVTFRQVDPLYLVDTSDPAAPFLAGELKVPGYSAYLHPVDDQHVLGVGQAADESGRTTGLQASLFDVSDPTAPRQVSTVTWAGAGSAVEADHRAFLLWQGRAYLPTGAGWSGATDRVLSVDVDAGGVSAGPVVDLRPGPDGVGQIGVERVLVVGDRIWLVGSGGIVQVAVGNRTVGTVVPF